MKVKLLKKLRKKGRNKVHILSLTTVNICVLKIWKKNITSFKQTSRLACGNYYPLYLIGNENIILPHRFQESICW